jgi:hypothetical protein
MPYQLQPIHHGHVEIRHDEVETACSECSHPSQAVLGFNDLDAWKPSQRLCQHVPHRFGVFDHQAAVLSHS